MTDAISRSAVLDAISKSTVIPCHEVVQAICDLPALDVAPVVYCKDCRYARPLNLRELMIFDSMCFVCTSQYGAGSSHPEYEMTGKVVFPKSFCSYAHRRTNGR